MCIRDRVSSDSFKKVNSRETTFNEIYSETADKIMKLMKYGHSDNFGVGYNDGNTCLLYTSKKTGIIKPGECEKLIINIPKSYIASYDDRGVDGYKSCYVLEEGLYKIYIGSDVRNAEESGQYDEKFTIVESLEEACAPIAVSYTHLDVYKRQDNI